METSDMGIGAIICEVCGRTVAEHEMPATAEDSDQ